MNYVALKEALDAAITEDDNRAQIEQRAKVGER